MIGSIWNWRTDCFREGTQNQGDHICPCLVPYAEAELDAEAEGEQGQEEGIGTEAGVITVDGEFDRTVDTDGGAILS